MRISTLLWYIIVALVVIWLVDLVAWHGGEIANALVVVAIVLLIYNLITGRRRV